MTDPDHSFTRESVTTASDPTKAVLGRSSLWSKYLQDYVVNVASGCSHGCQFCYVPATPNIRTRQDMLKERADVDDSQEEWGNYVLYRDGLGENLDAHLDRKRTWHETRSGQGIVGLSYSTDPYMDRRAGQIATRSVEALSDHNKFARVQTRNPLLAVADLETFTAHSDHVTVGSSINTLDEDAVQALEPRAPLPEARLEGLQRFSDAGVTVFVSMSPTYPTMGRKDIKRLMTRLAQLNPDVIFHEPINPRGDNFEMTVAAAEEAGEIELAEALTDLKHTGTWVEYSCRHLRWVQELADEMDLPVNLWPDDALIRNVSGDRERWLTQWRVRQSPEDFAGRPDPNGPMPELPSRPTTLQEYQDN